LVEEAKEAKRPVSDAVSVDAIRAMLSSEMGGLRTALGQQVEKVAEEVDAAKRQVSLLPNTIRSLERKVMDLHSSLSESRYKALLEQILRIYDMVDQVSRGVSNVPGCTALNETRRNYEVLKTQILQILKMNGLSEIPASGAVDFGLHQVMGKVPCKDRSVDGTIARVTRPGFRNDVGNTLRFAEVYVYGYEEPKQPECAGVAAPVSESAAACNRQ
jgi:molecular chaperone GrpE (heat shock protein)